jgi:hypothetical protein
MLKTNSALKELDLSNNFLEEDYGGDAVGFTQGICKGLLENSTLLTIVVDKSPLLIQDIKTKAKLDSSGKELDHLDAIIVAALLPLHVSGTIFGSP